MLPQEAAAKRILPLLRGAVTRALLDRGMSQHSVARLLGVSQPMVHKYASKPLNHYLRGLAAEGIDEEVAEAIVEAAVHEVLRDGLRGLARALNWAVLRSRYCQGEWEGVCPRILCPSMDYEALLSAILSLEGLPRLIPEVGSNLAYAPGHARDPGEALGLDGRIIRAGDKLVAAGRPVLGGSKHTGRVAVEYKDYVGGQAWAIALRGGRDVRERLERLGIPLVRLGEKPGGAARALAVVEPMAPGREEVVYLVAGDPGILYSLLRRLSS